MRASPMLPPTRTSPPRSRSMAPRAAVVVDLPLVPVTAATVPRRWRKASSISATTGPPPVGGGNVGAMFGSRFIGPQPPPREGRGTLLHARLRASLPLTLSPELQCRQREQREDEGHDPEADDDLRILPADQLEVMMERRHAEDPLAGELEGADLQDHGEGLDHEEAHHGEEQQLLLDQDRHRAQGPPEGQAPGVAHEHPGGVA